MQINIRQEQFSERGLQSRAGLRPVTPLGLRRCSGGYPEGSRGGGGVKLISGLAALLETIRVFYGEHEPLKKSRIS